MLDSAGLEVLGEQECLRLMATVAVGRVVFTDQALPAVLPVSFVLRDRTIVVGTGNGSRLAAAVGNSVVAFEADDVDPVARTGWSVTVTGRARLVRGGAEFVELSALDLRPWTSRPPEHFVVISVQIVDGQRLPA